MSALGIIMHYSQLFPQRYDISLMPMLYFSFAISVVFLGFTPFKERKLVSIAIDNYRLFKYIEIFLLIGSIFCILYFVPIAYTALKGDIGENRTDLIQLNENSIRARFGRYSILNSIASMIGNFFIVTQMFFFLNLIPIHGKIRTLKAVLMLIASMSYIIYVLAYVGRDGTVFWAMSFIFQYLFFKDFIEKKTRASVKKYGLILFGLISIPFILITIGRFQQSPLGVYWETINYMGQQIPNFNDFYLLNAPLQHGQFHFPVFMDMLRSLDFYDGPKMNTMRITSYFLSHGVVPWVFTTFIGGLILDFGKIGTLVLIAFLFLATRKLVINAIRTRSLRLSSYILLILYYQIVFFGVFYFRLYSANYYIIAMILLYFTFKILRGKIVQVSKIYN